MLSLTRRAGQRVIIGDPGNPFGTVTVGEISGDKVRVIFDFPTHVEVNREELAASKSGVVIPRPERKVRK